VTSGLVLLESRLLSCALLPLQLDALELGLVIGMQMYRPVIDRDLRPTIHAEASLGAFWNPYTSAAARTRKGNDTYGHDFHLLPYRVPLSYILQ
jgi:hypothetical protein